MGKRDNLNALITLLHARRWAALASVDQDGAPLASMVAYAVRPDRGELYLHLSQLAAHTGNLLQRPRCSLVISEVDTGHGDPQQLARLTLQGRVEVIERDSPAYDAAKALYLARLGDAQALFDFPDFILFRLVPEQARFVGGFARAFSYSADELLPPAGNG